MAGLFDDLLPEGASGRGGGAFDDLIPKKPKKRNLAAVANDTVIEVGNAVASGAGAVADMVSPGNRFSKGVDEFVKQGEASQSDVVKAEKQRFQQEMQDARGVGDEVSAVAGYVARNPGLAAAQAVGSFVGPGAAIKGAGAAAKAAGLGAQGVARAGLAGGAVAGGAMAGGDAAGTAYEIVMKAPEGALMATPEAQALASQGLPLDQIREQLATRAAREGSIVPAVLGAAGGVVGAERLFAGAGKVAGGALSRAVKTAGIEGAQEAVEEGVTAYSGQRAGAQYDPSVDPSKGVAGAAAMGGALGGITGAGVGALSRDGDPLKTVTTQSPAGTSTITAPSSYFERANAQREQAVEALSAAKSVDEAIEAATQLAIRPKDDLAPALGRINETTRIAKLRETIDQQAKPATAPAETTEPLAAASPVVDALAEPAPLAPGVEAIAAPVAAVQQTLPQAEAGPYAPPALDAAPQVVPEQPMPEALSSASVQAPQLQEQQSLQPAPPALEAPNLAGGAPNGAEQAPNVDQAVEPVTTAQALAINPPAVAPEINDTGIKVSLPPTRNTEVDEAAEAQDNGSTYEPDPEGQRDTDVFADRLTEARGGRRVVLRAVRAPVGDRAARAAQTLASRFFGKAVRFVQFDGSPVFNGAHFTGQPDTVYVRVDSPKPVMAVVGHELLHGLRYDRPDLYDTLASSIGRVMKEDGAYARQINERRAKQGMQPLDLETLGEELIADIVGDHFTEPQFWQAMAEAQPAGFRELAAAVKSFLEGLISKVTKLRPFGTERYLSDLKAARAAVVEAMRNYSAGEVGQVTDNGETIKFSTAAEDSADGAPGAQLATPKGDEYTSRGDFTAQQKAALARVFGAADARSRGQRGKDWATSLGTRLRDSFVQQVVDQYAPLKKLSPRAYLLARMSTAGDGTMEAALLYGKPFLRDGVADVDVNDSGFASVLADLQGEHQTFFQWVAAQRAEQLHKLGKERLFTQDDIAALKSLQDGTMPDGRSRSEVYGQALQRLNDFNDAMVKIAVESGLVDEEARRMFKDMPYVPFYRVLEDGPTGPKFSSALTGQKAWQKLKGGTNVLQDDLLANVLRNWSHLLTASAKNRAAVEAFKEMESQGVAEPAQASDKGTVHVMVDGRSKHYLVHDAALAEAIGAMHYAVPGFMKPLMGFKRLLTYGVTLFPDFKLRNLIRDSVQSVAVSPLGANPLANVREGMEKAEFGTAFKNMALTAVGKGPKTFAPQNQTFASALASGAVMRFGSLVEGDRAHHAEHMIRRARANVTLDETAGKKLLHYLADVMESYKEFGDASEQANRLALYNQLLSKGYSHGEAAFMARDLLDFSKQGKAPVIRFLVQTVPFLNARIQGLAKLGEAATAGTEDQKYRLGRVAVNKRFANVAGSVVMASLVLMLLQQDDEDWKQREDWDRDGYWWFKIGDIAFRLPKPFELGALGTLAERTWELMDSDNKDVTLSKYGERIGHMLAQTFAFNPLPQVLKPLVDVYANQDSFSGRPIEGLAMEKLRPEDRYDEKTSMAARWLGQVGLPNPVALANLRYESLSPAQLDHLIRGYFGTLGVVTAGAVDALARPLAGEGERPERTLKQQTWGFFDDLPADQSRYVSALYDRAQEVEQAYSSYRAALASGDVERAAEIREESGPLISQRGRVEKAKQRLADINKAIRRINADQDLDGEAKRQRLTPLYQQRNRIARQVEEALPAM